MTETTGVQQARATETDYYALLRQHCIACVVCTPPHIDGYCHEGRELLSIVSHARARTNWLVYSQHAFTRPSAP